VFIVDHDFHYATSEYTPRLKVHSSDFKFEPSLIGYDTKTVDISAMIGNYFAQTSKPILLSALRVPLNNLLPVFANNGITTLVEEMHGHVGGSLIRILLNLLPQNNIEVSPDITLSLSEIKSNFAKIKDGRISGYFTGDVNLPVDQVISEKEYLSLGKLDIDTDAQPGFEF